MGDMQGQEPVSPHRWQWSNPVDGKQSMVDAGRGALRVKGVLKAERWRAQSAGMVWKDLWLELTATHLRVFKSDKRVVQHSQHSLHDVDTVKMVSSAKAPAGTLGFEVTFLNDGSKPVQFRVLGQKACGAWVYAILHNKEAAQRAAGGWGSTFPGHLLPDDRCKWTNDEGQQSMRLEELAAPQADSKWVVDTNVHGGCDSLSGWQYDTEFADFDRYHLPHYKAYDSFAASTTFVRRRRWTQVASSQDSSALVRAGLIEGERMSPDEKTSEAGRPGHSSAAGAKAEDVSMMSPTELTDLQSTFRPLVPLHPTDISSAGVPNDGYHNGSGNGSGDGNGSKKPTPLQKAKRRFHEHQQAANARRYLQVTVVEAAGEWAPSVASADSVLDPYIP
jgi:hypothetical protein